MWDVPGEPWESYGAVILRSCWDYHLRTHEFLRWLDDLEQSGAFVLNPLPTIRWNATKTYLRDLADAGVSVVPTEIVEAGAAADLHGVMRDHGWRDVVIKPTVSATAFETWRVGPAPTSDDEARFARLVRDRGMMVQPYVASIEGEGELSLMFLDGRFSHAVRKRPRAGDFRVQDEFGGTVEAAAVAEGLAAEAGTIVARTPDPCLYARVDGCVVDGRFLLMELEVIEPSLFFQFDEGSADRLALAVRREIDARR